MKAFLGGLMLGIVLAVCVPLAVLASGAVNMGATAGPGLLEQTLAEFAVERSAAWRAPEKANPFGGDPQALETGLTHFGAMCVQCHGAPGVAPDEFALGLNPPAPPLEEAHAEFTDGELFWIIKHGVRMTGMPAFGETHSNEELWKIAAFVRHLPEATDEELARLQEARATGHEHGDHDHAQRHHDDPSHGDHGHE